MSRAETPHTHHGVLLIDKEAGWTSHDVVAKVRRLFGQKKVGHTGTLDPMATGLLVVCLGKATRLVEYMTEHDKEYEGIIKLGVATETDDAEGALVERRPVTALEPGDLLAIRERFSGTIAQVPPQYSAVKTGGQRAYAVARRGGTSELRPRTVTVHELAVTPGDESDTLAIRVRCSAGTYIRSIARDIGAMLGCGAHLASLRRTAVGEFDVAAAERVGSIEALDADVRGTLLLPPGAGLGSMPRVDVDADDARKLAAGMTVEWPCSTHQEGPVLVFAGGEQLVGVGSRVGAEGLRCGKVLAAVDEIEAVR